jgi:hypothetical protein
MAMARPILVASWLGEGDRFITLYNSLVQVFDLPVQLSDRGNC